MKLHPKLVSYIAETVVVDLVKDKKISVTDDRLICGLVENVIEEEFEKETRLDEEVRDILSEHYEQMRHTGASYDEMFRKVKARLAKEKGIAL